MIPQCMIRPGDGVEEPRKVDLRITEANFSCKLYQESFFCKSTQGKYSSTFSYRITTDDAPQSNNGRLRPEGYTEQKSIASSSGIYK